MPWVAGDQAPQSEKATARTIANFASQDIIDSRLPSCLEFGRLVPDRRVSVEH